MPLPPPHPRRRGRWVFAVCVALILGADAVRAMEIPVEFHIRTWTTDNGLPHNSVNVVLQDATGFMWFATMGGLARFDGLEFREIRPPVEYRATGLNIRDLAEERPGVLVVLPTGNTVLQFSAAGWRVHPLNTALAPLQDAPAAVHIDASKNVWIVTAGGRLLRWSQDGRTKIFGPETGLANRSRRLALTTDSNGGTWVNADQLWFAEPGGELRPVPNAPEDQRIIGAGRNGRVWLLTSDRLYRLERGGFRAEQDILLRGNFAGVRQVCEDRSGAVWIASSRQGLLRVANGKVTRISSYATVSTVTEDREGNLWVATDGSGAGELREKAYRLFSSADGLRQDVVSSLSEDHGGRVWLANRIGGLPSIGADGRVQPSILTGSRTFANVVAVDAQGLVWFGGGRNGLFRWQPGTDVLEHLATPAADLHVLFRARNNDLWFAADPNEVGFYRGDQLHLVSGPNVPLSEVRTIGEDGSGAIWLGGRSGELVRWRDGQVDRFGPADGLPHALIHALSADTEGRIWLGTAAGLVLHDGQRFHLLTEANGLADEIIQEIVDDHRGNLWFASRRGLFHATKSDVLAAVHDPDHRIECHRLGPNHGLVGITPTPNYNPGALCTRDGVLWFATAQGALAVDPARLPRDLPAPPVHIDEVNVDGAPVAPAPGLRIPPGRHRVDFRFVALSFTAPESVLLRHRLDGVDRQWIDTPVDRTATYTNLAPGAYRMRVIARNSSGQWNLQGTELAFTVVPAWWETLGFRLAAALLLVTAVATLARKIAQRRLKLRLRRLEQQHALEKERNRIARDLHDELGAGLTEVGLLADRLVAAAPRDLAGQLSGLAWRTRRLATDLSGIVWTMNASHSSLDHLAVFLRRYAERLFRNTGTRCLVQGVETIPAIPLAPERQHQLLAATKEALNNIVKHARATETLLELRFTDQVFELQIRDNGVGCALPPAEASDGNGLRNMRTRIEEIGGSFHITSSPGAGTVVGFRLPCPAAAPTL